MPTKLFSAYSTTISVFLRMKLATFACAGQQHLDTVELATLSSGVEVQPSSTTGANLDVSGKCRVSKIDVVAI